MTSRLLTRTLLLVLVSAALLPLAAQTPGSAAAEREQWREEISAWRTQHEKEVSAPDGWLTLAGLDWLKPGFNAVGSAEGSAIKLPLQAPAKLGLITVSGKTLQLLAPAGGFPEGLTIDGKLAREGQINAGGEHPSLIAWHSLTLLVLERGGRFLVRIKDSDSPNLTAFHGLNWYPPDPHFRIIALWTPYTPPHIEKIPTVLGNTLDLPAPGVAEFTLNGRILKLEPVLEDPQGKTLFFILRDETSKTTTYQAARFLHTGLPNNGLDQPGILTLDFNKLENPPCAYTPYATCPLPPEQNKLPVAIEAGEERYGRQ
jgi:hypothetical protein